MRTMGAGTYKPGNEMGERPAVSSFKGLIDGLKKFPWRLLYFPDV